MATALNNPGTTLTVKRGRGILIPIDYDVSGSWNWKSLNDYHLYSCRLCISSSRLTTLSRKYKGVFSPKIQMKKVICPRPPKGQFISNHLSALNHASSHILLQRLHPRFCTPGIWERIFSPNLCVYWRAGVGMGSSAKGENF